MTPEEKLIALSRVRAMLKSGVAKAIRELALVSQSEIAKALGIASPTINRWEAGMREPRPALALKYGDLLDGLAENLRPVEREAHQHRIAAWLEEANNSSKISEQFHWTANKVRAFNKGGSIIIFSLDSKGRELSMRLTAAQAKGLAEQLANPQFVERLNREAVEVPWLEGFKFLKASG